MKTKFKAWQHVRHLKSGEVYLIIGIPTEVQKLEYCNESYYSYCGTAGVVWLRRQTEMEDGRFELL